MRRSSARNRIPSVEEFVADALALPAEQQEALRRELNTMPLSDCSGAYHCAYLDTRLVSPCGLASCPYRVANAEIKNCLRNFKFSNDKLTAGDLQRYMGINASGFKALMASAMLKMRRNLIIDELVASGANRFSYVFGTKVCVGCGNLAETREVTCDVLGGDKVFSYCCQGCHEQRPPHYIRIEHFFGAEVQQVLRTAKSVFKRLDMIASVLEVKKPVLLDMYARIGLQERDFACWVDENEVDGE